MFIFPFFHSVGRALHSGFFLDFEGPPHYHTGMTWAFYQQNSSSGVNAACIAAKDRDRQSECMFAQHTAPYIQTPTFPLQSVYDSWQVGSEDHILQP